MVAVTSCCLVCEGRMCWGGRLAQSLAAFVCECLSDFHSCACCAQLRDGRIAGRSGLSDGRAGRRTRCATSPPSARVTSPTRITIDIRAACGSNRVARAARRAIVRGDRHAVTRERSRGGKRPDGPRGRRGNGERDVPRSCNAHPWAGGRADPSSYPAVAAAGAAASS